MQCEMCGQTVPSCKKVRVEGTMMDVCSKCARFGDDVVSKTPQKKATSPIVAQRLERRENRPIYKDVFTSEDTGTALIHDYANKIMQARNSKRMTKKEFAAKINEKLSVVHSLERGELHPDDKLIKKLEKELGIPLREKVADVKMDKKAYVTGMTLGDFIRKEN